MVLCNGTIPVTFLEYTEKKEETSMTDQRSTEKLEEISSTGVDKINVHVTFFSSIMSLWGTELSPSKES